MLKGEDDCGFQSLALSLSLCVQLLFALLYFGYPFLFGATTQKTMRSLLGEGKGTVVGRTVEGREEEEK